MLDSQHAETSIVGRPHNLDAALQQALIGWPEGLIQTMEDFIRRLQQFDIVAGFDATNEEVEVALRRLAAGRAIRPLGQFVDQVGRHRRVAVGA